MDALSPSIALPTPPAFRMRITPLRLIGALVLATIALRLFGAATRPLWLDEGYSAWFSSRGWRELWTVVPTYETHPPFYYSLLKLWRQGFGGTPLGLRSFSLLFAAAVIPVVIAASNELERQRPSGRPLLRAGFAAFLMACSPMLVLLGSEARPYPLLIFAYALALLGVLRMIREFADGGAGTGTSWLMLVAGTEVGLWAHGLGPIYGASLAAAFAPAWLAGITRARLIRGLTAATLIAALYLPCLLIIAGRAGDWGSGWLRWEPIMALHLFGLYAIPFELMSVTSAIAALVMILLAKRGIQWGIEARGWNAERAILLLWWGPPLTAILISVLAVPVFLPRTLSPTLVPAYLAIAGVLARIESPRERLALGAALAITILPATLQVATRPGLERWDEVAAYLARNVHRGEQVWLYPNDSALPLREAGSRVAARGIPGDYPATQFKGPIRAGSPAVVSLTAEQAREVSNAPANRAPRIIWLVTRQADLFDPAADLPKALAAVRRPGPLQKWDAITVRPYYRR